MTLYTSITDIIGNTPLLRLQRTAPESTAEIYVKLEFYSPAGSAKDRIGVAIVDAAEKSGLLPPGGTIVEATSGNTGIALAWVGAARGHKVILTMPASMSRERRALLRGFGAELVLTDPAKGMQGAVDKAREIADADENAILASQFTNTANPQIHERTTGPEIWKDLDGKVDIFVAGVGTGGTLTGTGRYLRRKNPRIRIVAVEPADSPLLSQGKAGSHKIQGIGANFIPEILDPDLYDEVIPVEFSDALHTAQTLARRDGVLAGISGGAALWAGLELARREENAGRRIVVILPDFGERYISTPLFAGLTD
ncbi:cysteine synthase A [Arcanobacterium sp. S3PF19]|uniref:cysteine synthase A n=1 Tax=Arcanobacterium sp. S3PF19 TaxID=1219585 RepID=UPI00050F260F|nr:cysteine synthase A [Arcanobacterium sp. S3PF19]KGF05530.1 cysteine synthase [Arcanobacterium sp. S3PF19]